MPQQWVKIGGKSATAAFCSKEFQKQVNMYGNQILGTPSNNQPLTLVIALFFHFYPTLCPILRVSKWFHECKL